MKKTTAYLISIILLLAFSGSVYYGLKYSRGKPVAIEKKERAALDVPFLNKSINLNKGLSPNIWETITAKEIKLMHQITVLPWTKSLISPISVKSFHNEKDIYFYLEWKDETEDRVFEENRFSDACAIMFPIGENIPSSTIMMGFMAKSNIWQWKAVQDAEFWFKIFPQTKAYADLYYPFEEKEIFPVSKVKYASAVNNLMAIRVGTLTPLELQNVEGRGFWKDGMWNVVFKRSLEVNNPLPSTNLPIFTTERKRLIAFAVWNGANGDRGGRKSMSDWVELEMEK